MAPLEDIAEHAIQEAIAPFGGQYSLGNAGKSLFIYGHTEEDKPLPPELEKFLGVWGSGILVTYEYIGPILPAELTT